MPASCSCAEGTAASSPIYGPHLPRAAMALAPGTRLDSPLLTSLTHSSIHLLRYVLHTSYLPGAVPGAEDMRARQGQHPWGEGGKQTQQCITHLCSLTRAVMRSLRTSSGRCGLRSEATRPPSLPLEGRGLLPFLTGPSLLPALNQPLVLVSARLQPRDTAVSRFSVTRRWPVPSGPFSREVRWGQGRAEGAVVFSRPEAVPLTGSFVDCGRFTTTNGVSTPSGPETCSGAPMPSP